jgi:hypothetical protein
VPVLLSLPSFFSSLLPDVDVDAHFPDGRHGRRYGRWYGHGRWDADGRDEYANGADTRTGARQRMGQEHTHTHTHARASMQGKGGEERILMGCGVVLVSVFVCRGQCLPCSGVVAFRWWLSPSLPLIRVLPSAVFALFVCASVVQCERDWRHLRALG